MLAFYAIEFSVGLASLVTPQSKLLLTSVISISYHIKQHLSIHDHLEGNGLRTVGQKICSMYYPASKEEPTLIINPQLWPATSDLALERLLLLLYRLR